MRGDCSSGRGRYDDLAARLAAAEAALDAVAAGAVDALAGRDGAAADIVLLQRADSFFVTLVTQMQEATASVDSNGTVLYANPRFAELLKLPLSQVLGRTLPELTHEAGRAAARQLLAGAASGPVRGTLELVRGDGRSVPVSVAAAPIVGEPPEVCVVATDLTERNQAENALRVAEERFRSAFEHAPIGMALLSLDGRFERVNAVLATMVGRPAAELLGTPLASLLDRPDATADMAGPAGIHPGQTEDCRTDVLYAPPRPWVPDDEVHQGGRAQLDAALRSAVSAERGHLTVSIYHGFGYRVLVETSFVAVCDPRGGAKVLVATMRDVTAQHAAAARARQLSQLTTHLAQASSVREVVQVGLDELAALWGARQVVMARWSASGERNIVSTPPLSEPLGRLPELAASALEDARASGARRVLANPVGEGATVYSIACPILAQEASTAVWLQLATPREMSQEDHALFVLLCDYIGVALERARLFDEQQIVASVLQQSILSQLETPVGVAARYLPAVRPLQVGGDWYDAITLRNGQIALVVGDCVGCGLQAASVMGQLRSAARALLLQAHPPARMLEALDDFAARVTGAFCTTVFCAVIDPDSATIDYSSAGHPPAILVHLDGTTEQLADAGSVPLAIVPSLERPHANARLRPGSTLLMYTDGLIERRSESLEIGLDRLARVTGRGRALQLESLVDLVLDEVLPDAGSTDDVAVLAYRHPGGPPGDLAASLAADPSQLTGLRQSLRAWLAPLALDQELVQDLLVAVNEAASNAIEHGCRLDVKKTVHVTARATGDELDFQVTDPGVFREDDGTAQVTEKRPASTACAAIRGSVRVGLG